MDFEAVTPEELLGPLNEVEEKNAPKTLYLAGDRALFSAGTRVSVVGARKCSAEGEKRTRSLVLALVERRIIVVSGLAEGVDTVAHETAMAAEGRTIAVLGTPLDDVFPRKNRALQERMMREQLVVSQFPKGSKTTRGNFPIRNRTMALLSEATVIVEASENSGTVHQGWEALRLGRLLYLLQSVVENPRLSWAKEMRRYGAQVLTKENLPLALENMPQRTRAEELPF